MTMLQVGAEATQIGEMCLKDEPAGGPGSFWRWLTLFAIVLLLVGFATVVFFAWRKLTSDLNQCWNQVADEDSYIAKQGDMRVSSEDELRATCRNRICILFADLQTKTIDENRWESADRYETISSSYGT
eukprot:s424_g9.t1